MRWLLFGMGVLLGGGITAALFLMAGMPWPIGGPLMLQRVTRKPLPELRKFFPDEEHYALLHNGRTVAHARANDAGVLSLYALTPDRSRWVSIQGANGVFPACVCVERMPPGVLHPPRLSFYDDDLDGLPDRRYEWGAKRWSTCTEVKWTVRDTPATAPAAAAPGPRP